MENWEEELASHFKLTAVKQVDEILKEMEKFRLRHEYDNPPEPTDWAIRVCQAIVAERGGYPNRAAWNHIGQQIREGGK